MAFPSNELIESSIVSSKENSNQCVSVVSSILSHLLLCTAEPLTNGWQNGDRRQEKKQKKQKQMAALEEEGLDS